MESHKCFSFLVMVLLGFIVSCQAHKFYVGGKDGWVLKPSEDYNHWAGRNRFQVNDTLIFKYKNGSDSVLLVNKDDYYSCNKENPTRILKTDQTKIKFHRSGPFFFISGHEDNCEKGQKLIIVVLAVRHPKTPTPPPVPPSPPPAPEAPISPSPVAEAPKPESPDSGMEVFPPDSDAAAPAPSSAPGSGRLGDLVMGLSVVFICFVGLF